MEPILEAAFGDRVFYEPSHSLHAAGTVWHSDAGQDRWNRPDPALAKLILAEAGYDGTPVRWLATYEYPWMVEIAYAAKEQLAAVGIPVDVEILDWASLVARRADPDAWEIFVTSFPSAVHPMENPYLASEWPGWWRSEARDALIQELLRTRTSTTSVRSGAASRKFSGRNCRSTRLASTSYCGAFVRMC